MILIRGAPGAGKSTLARIFRKNCEDGVTVEVDTVRGMINSVKWVNSEEHINALKATWALCKSYLLEYRPIIVIDTFSPSKLEQFLSQIGSNSTSLKYLVISLYCSDNVLKERIVNRKSGYKEIDNCLILNHEVLKYRHKHEIFFDTTTLSPETVYQDLVSQL